MGNQGKTLLAGHTLRYEGAAHRPDDDLRAYVERDPEGGYRWWVERWDERQHEKSTPAGWVSCASGQVRDRDDAHKAARRALAVIREPQREEIR